MLEFPEWLVIPLADWIDAIMDWVLSALGSVFDVISDLVGSGILGAISSSSPVERYAWLIPGVWWSFLILAVALVALVAFVYLSLRIFKNTRTAIFIGFALLIGFFSIIFGLNGIKGVLLDIPWWLIIAMVGYAAWRATRKWWAGPVMAGLLVLIGTFRFGALGYWDLAMDTLSIIITSVILCLGMGIPIGILMARSNRAEAMIKPFLDAMQTMPSFVYLVPVMILFGLGKVPATFATILYAVPPLIRLTNTGIRQVPKSIIEAGQAFGATKRQVLLEIQLPLATPSIMVGINQTTMMALAMVVIASMVGAGGLGLEVLRSLQNLEVGRGFQAGLSIVLLAIVIDRITSAMAAGQQNKSKVYQ
jgi:glycine betaine/proline transport system permease protein